MEKPLKESHHPSTFMHTPMRLEITATRLSLPGTTTIL